MPLSKKQIQEIKDELDNCKKPLFFFDDDPDGLCSFLLLYRYKKEGQGFIIKSKPFIDNRFLKKVQEYQPDKLFILDMAIVEQEFIDNVNVPVVIIDHHEPIKVERAKYFNPRVKKQDEYYPTTAIAYDIIKRDMWIAMVGCISDMYIPKFKAKFKKQYKGFIGNEKKTQDIYFKTKLGELLRIFSFLLKGETSEVNKSFRILTRINEPNEILEQLSSAGQFLYKRAKAIEKEYLIVQKDSLKNVKEDKVLIYIYYGDKMSFTGDLANELIYNFPDKIVIVGRERNEEVRMSLRSSATNLRDLLKKALVNVEGYGGGHEFACGASVKKRDFDIFIKQIKENVQ